MRNLTKSIVAVSVMTSTSAYSLGIGDIKLRSALNENLNAEIALFATEGESSSNIQVKLASPAKFDQAGIPWSYFLSKIRFVSTTKPDGSMVVTLTSSEALKEPFLNFLLEVSWPKGIQYREYTVLVDPPASYKQKELPVVTTTRAPMPVFVTPERYRNSTQASRPAAVDYQPSIPAAPAEPMVDEYGPVRKNDTLWKIANKVRPAGVSTAQMAIALYENNPEAFASPNLNTLLTGQTLHVPERQEIEKLSPKKALTEFNQQRRQYRQQLAEAAEQRRAEALAKMADSPKAIDTEQAEQAEQMVAPPAAVAEEKPKSAVEKPKAAPKPAATEPAVPATKQLTLEAPSEAEISEKMNVAAGEAARSQAEAINAGVVAMTSAKKQELAKETEAIEQRFQRIEQQLETMQKLLELKNEQLGVTQANNAALSAMAEQQLKALAQPVVEKPALPDAMQPPVAAVKHVVPPKVSAPPPPVASSDPLFSGYYTTVGLVGGLLLTALGWVWWRKRKEVYVEDLDEMLAGSNSQMAFGSEEMEQFKPAKMDTGPVYDVGMVSESAFLSEFTPSEFDAFETEHAEIDPISEADVYLAYGRYQQAEDLMHQAIKEQPERNECKLKLLEIYQTNANKVAFDNYVQELIKQGKQSDQPFWEKVVDMASLLNPGTELLLKPAAVTALPVEETKAPAEVSSFDLSSFSLDDAATKPDAEAASAPLSAAPVVNFNKNFAAVMDEDVAELLEPRILDFNLDKAAVTADVQPVMPEASDSSGAVTNLLDFDLSQFRVKHDDLVAPIVADSIEADASHQVEFDLAALSSHAPANDLSVQLPMTDDVAFADSDALFADLTVTEADVDLPSDVGEFSVDEFNSPAFDLDALGVGQVQHAELDNLFDTNADSFAVEFSDFAEDNAVPAMTADNQAVEANVDLYAFSVDEPSATSAENQFATKSDAALIDELAAFDFDFSVDEIEQVNTGDSSYLNTEMQTFDDFDFSLDELSEHSKKPGGLSIEKDVEEFNFDLPLGELNVTPASAESAIDTFSVDDLTDGNGALDTKINLANAYIDMGDMDAARSIAEMLLHGPKKHKQAAKKILAKIN